MNETIDWLMNASMQDFVIVVCFVVIAFAALFGK